LIPHFPLPRPRRRKARYNATRGKALSFINHHQLASGLPFSVPVGIWIQIGTVESQIRSCPPLYTRFFPVFHIHDILFSWAKFLPKKDGCDPLIFFAGCMPIRDKLLYDRTPKMLYAPRNAIREMCLHSRPSVSQPVSPPAIQDVCQLLRMLHAGNRLTRKIVKLLLVPIAHHTRLSTSMRLQMWVVLG